MSKGTNPGAGRLGQHDCSATRAGTTPSRRSAHACECDERGRSPIATLGCRIGTKPGARRAAGHRDAQSAEILPTRQSAMAIRRLSLRGLAAVDVALLLLDHCGSEVLVGPILRWCLPHLTLSKRFKAALCLSGNARDWSQSHSPRNLAARHSGRGGRTSRSCSWLTLVSSSTSWSTATGFDLQRDRIGDCTRVLDVRRPALSNWPRCASAATVRGLAVRR